MTDVDVAPGRRAETAPTVVARSLGRHSPRCGVGDRTARSTTTARTRAARSARARSRTGCCAARGTATTTTRSPGSRPPGFADAPAAYPVEVRDGRRLRRSCRDGAERARTVSDVMVETLVAWGVDTRLRHGRALQPRVRRRAAPRRGARRAHATSASATRARRRSRPRPTASSPAGRRPASPSPGPGSTNLLTGLYDAKARPARRCSRSPARCRRRCSAAARSRTSTSSAVFRDVAVSTATVHAGSDHAELAAARGQARARRPRRRPPRAPRRGAGAARRDAPAARAGRPPRRPAHRAARTRSTPRCDLLARRPPAGDHRRARRARGAWTSVRRAGRAARRAGAHHVQGQGPGPRHPPARRRRARPQRHAGGELADERVRPAARGRRVVLQPHRHRAVQADRPGRRRPDGARPVPPGRPSPCSATSASRCARCSTRLPATADGGRPARRRRRALGDLARREGAPRAPTTAAAASRRAAVFAALDRPLPGRRGDRRRRRQPRLLVRPLLRVRAASRC